MTRKFMHLLDVFQEAVWISLTQSPWNDWSNGANKEEEYKSCGLTVYERHICMIAPQTYGCDSICENAGRRLQK